MDLNHVIEELLKERNRLDTLIKTLEKGLDPSPPRARSTRGRKSMSAAERAQVAERMRRYWAARKEAPPPSPDENQ